MNWFLKKGGRVMRFFSRHEELVPILALFVLLIILLIIIACIG
ncbi:hypothetical protein HMPREF0083_01173 [Aneurinibacillus aneurinilyticus ATCC 12856]|uniref:Uncharacterized protein n=1 Tax=Aneurinibacillus aneurinilyticus ATCC 12856 TaxID=649747 RepID=U1X718_ANEAE|nr:hypothetical protein HMPREF0083_01173 [Aneurinibacillus aneurinilyticus ATCC 12856]